MSQAEKKSQLQGAEAKALELKGSPYPRQVAWPKPRGYIGYMEPYAASHQALDSDDAFQHEVMNVARALGNAVKLSRAGKLEDPGQGLVDPEPK
jgi:hypothetical protein